MVVSSSVGVLYNMSVAGVRIVEFSTTPETKQHTEVMWSKTLVDPGMGGPGGPPMDQTWGFSLILNTKLLAL